jgi:hypothetical protein
MVSGERWGSLWSSTTVQQRRHYLNSPEPVIRQYLTARQIYGRNGNYTAGLNQLHYNNESKLLSRLKIQFGECLLPFSSEFLSIRLLSTHAKVNRHVSSCSLGNSDVSEAVDTTHPRVLTLHQCRCETRSHTKEITQSEGTRQHVSEDMRGTRKEKWRETEVHIMRGFMICTPLLEWPNQRRLNGWSM